MGWFCKFHLKILLQTNRLIALSQALHFMKTIREVHWEHYEHRYNGNMWEYLGNGRVKAEIFKEFEKLAPYMRNSDVPYEIE